jgi:hypothetical protein
MSTPVFIDWFFAWVSKMRIDFRQQCGWCGGKSNILACDGTKLGIFFLTIDINLKNIYMGTLIFFT